MANGLQHCAKCQEEYVAGVAACVECGGPLQPGELPAFASKDSPAVPVTPSAATAVRDQLIAEMPGAHADQFIRALLIEGIPCRVECDGEVRLYEADQKPAEPFAVTLPVTVYVDRQHYDTANEILASLQQEDVIGDQWAVGGESEEADTEPAPDDAEETPDDDREALDPVVDDGPKRSRFRESPAYEVPRLSTPKAEGTTMRTIMLILIFGLVLLFVFGR